MFTLAAAIISGFVALVSGIVSGVVSHVNNLEATAATQQEGEKDRQLTQQLNEKNRQYELEDQARLEQREDTAIQRRMADLQAAGINPLLAGSQGGAQSGTISARNTSLQPSSIASTLAQIISNNQIPNIIQSTGMNVANSANAIINREKTLAEIEKLKAETDGKKTETINTEMEIMRKEIEIKYTQENAKQELKKKIQENQSLEQAVKTATKQYEHMLNAEERAKAEHMINQQLKEQEKAIKDYQQKLDQAKDEREKQELEQEIKEFKVNTGFRIIDSIGNWVIKGAEYGLEIYDRHINKRDKNNRRYRP